MKRRAQQQDYLESKTLSEVAVHLVSPDATIRGLLTLVAPDGVVLTAAKHADTDTALSGDQFLPAWNIAWVQVLRPA